MPAPYDLTNITNSTNLADVVGNANALVGQSFAILTLILLFAIVFIASKNYFTKQAASAAAYITAISSILFFVLGWIGQNIMMMAIVLLAVIIAWQRLTAD